MRHLELRSGIYRDSVQLMQISSALSKAPGVEHALVAMATELNLDLLPDMGIDPPAGANPNDLVVALVAADEESLAAALDRLEQELTGPAPGSLSGSGPSGSAPSDAAVPARTTASATRSASRSGDSLVLVSTPGRYAFVEAMDALDAGCSVMIFSDNVPVEQEVRLKQVAADRGLLVMGPDCGTAVVGGIGLGFANVVRPGVVGLVAASGTGAQHVMSLLAAAGVGISSCLGVGGRDLSDVVGGRSTLAALDALDADPATELIVVLSKPPAPSVASAVRTHASTLDTPVVVAPLGLGAPDLTAVAEGVLSRLGVPVPAWPSWTPGSASSHGEPGREVILGLFSGGTLCVEAQVVASATVGEIRSNVPLRPEWTATQPQIVGKHWSGHTMIDLGADEYTVGRPHPMIDPGPRLALIEAAAADPAVGVLLLDVVLGHGAHPDPAAALAPAIRAAVAGAKTVVVSLVGTPDDPQDLTGQARALCDAGAHVFASNAQAARFAASVGAAPAGAA